MEMAGIVSTPLAKQLIDVSLNIDNPMFNVPENVKVSTEALMKDEATRRAIERRTGQSLQIDPASPTTNIRVQGGQKTGLQKQKDKPKGPRE